MNLVEKKCESCKGGMPPLNNEIIKELKKQLKGGWEIINDKLIKEYAFPGFSYTMDFVNNVAKVSEEEDHHPVMHVYYSKVEIELWTHTINGLSENDFILAAKIDEL